MMNRSLGKIFIIALLPVLLLAKVSVSVDKPVVYEGDSVVFTITAEGKNVTFPDITAIDGVAVSGTSSSSNVRIINGNYSKSISKSYSLSLKKELHIPSYEVKVDGKTEKTKPLTVKTVKPTKDPNAAVVLDLRLEKREAYVGEAIRFDIVFKRRLNARVDQIQIEEPKFEDFWIKKIDGIKQGSEGEYVTQTYSYLLFAQKSGKLTIPALTAEVGQTVRRNSKRGMNDAFFNSFFSTRMQVSKIFSNEAVLDVKPLPGGLELFGDFNIKVSVDKQEVHANKPVNLTVSIDGVGNLDDIQKFTPDIDGAIVYANEPEIHTRISGKDYLGSFEQKIAVIGDSDYTIPPLTLRYFDRNMHKEVVKKSDPIKIHVIGGAVKKQNTFVAADTESSEEISLSEKDRTDTNTTAGSSKMELLYAAIVGFGIGVLFHYMMIRIRNEKRPKKKKIGTMERKIGRAKDDRTLFELLLPYKKESATIADALEKLEDNLYRGAKNSIDKKALISYFRGEEEETEFV